MVKENIKIFGVISGGVEAPTTGLDFKLFIWGVLEDIETEK